MFISKARAVVVPQSEHQRLAGILARHWGNETFKLPKVDRASFLLGVATHDRAFGYLDDAALGQISQERRAEQVGVWLNTTYDDPAAELVVLLHVRRLMHTPEHRELRDKVHRRVTDVVSTHSLDLITYEQADTITDLCDRIAFDFSFEAATEQTVRVFQDENANADVTYRLSDGKVALDPWPFRVPEIEGYILGYKQDGYPENLQPVLLDFEIAPG